MSLLFLKLDDEASRGALVPFDEVLPCAGLRFHALAADLISSCTDVNIAYNISARLYLPILEEVNLRPALLVREGVV